MKQLRVAIADDEVDMREYFQAILTHLGHDVVSLCEDGRQLVEACKRQCPDLVITDVRMPDMDGLDAAQDIYQERPVPMIVVSAYHDEEFVERAQRNHILAYLVKPVRQTDLEPAIAIAMRRFSEFEAMRKEARDLRQALEDRKTVERAKGILMKQAQLDEEAAFRRLQKLASSNNRTLIDVARMIVMTADVLRPDRDAKP